MFRLILIAAWCAFCSNTWAQDSQRPNVLFIFLDDYGWRDCGYMGSDFYETPNIDALARSGMIFSNAYSAAANCASGAGFPVVRPILAASRDLQRGNEASRQPKIWKTQARPGHRYAQDQPANLGSPGPTSGVSNGNHRQVAPEQGSLAVRFRRECCRVAQWKSAEGLLSAPSGLLASTTPPPMST